MIETEVSLWNCIAKAVLPGECFTRIETRIHEGVADVEYSIGTVHGWHGWVELKVSSSRPNTPLKLHHPFMPAQASWLLNHHNPRRYQRSWLLVGFPGNHRWEEFLLLPPTQAVCLVHGRHPPLVVDVVERPGVFMVNSAQAVMEVIRHRGQHNG